MLGLNASSRAGSGDGGFITVSANGNLIATGDIEVKAISDIGNGGTISLNSHGDLMDISGNINFSAYGDGNGGLLVMDEPRATRVGGTILGIGKDGGITANAGSIGDGGSISIAAEGKGTSISLGTPEAFATIRALGGTESGAGGIVSLTGTGDISVDASINVSARGTGNGGSVTILEQRPAHFTPPRIFAFLR